MKSRKKSIISRLIFSMTLFMFLSTMSLIITIVILVANVHIYLSIILVISMFILVIINIIYLYRGVYFPLKDTNNKLISFNQGYNSDAISDIKYFYTDEIEETFKKIINLSDNLNAIKISNMHAEYTALQNQINPHFLYNTLEAIRSDAICAGAHDIAHITEALAIFFRYTISNVNSLVNLEEELANVENYFAIQKYRFGDKIAMKISSDEEDVSIFEYQIPKLTLQPIIENAILHGLEYKVDKGMIQIDITKTDDRLIIKVMDDGVGIKQKELDIINHRLFRIRGKELGETNSKRGGIALVNVNNRIKLLLGEKYGLRLTSIENYGTSIEVTLPLTKSDNR